MTAQIMTNELNMIKNYIKIAYRNLLHNKVYSLINIAGLSIGLAACLLVATVVMDDLSYDRQWKNAANIYRINSINRNTKTATEKFASSFTGLGPEMKKLFPEVKDYCRLDIVSEHLKIGAGSDGIKFMALSAEPSVWNVFDFKVLKGKPQKYIKGYRNLVISEKLGRQFFPGINPVGKVIYTNPEFGKPQALLITGVIKDIPSNTHLRADLLLIKPYEPFDDQLNKTGDGTFMPQYLLLENKADVAALTAKMNKWYLNYISGGKAAYKYELQPVKDIYLRSDFANAQLVQGNMRTIYILSAVAVLLLLIGCINFINLTTARAFNRVKESGIRKILGANRQELISQFLSESLMFFVISSMLALFAYILAIKPLQGYLGHQLTITFYNNSWLIAFTVSFILVIALMTGIYPAYLFTNRNPLQALSGRSPGSSGSAYLRKSLVVTQFVISIGIIVAAFVVYNQLSYINNKDLGYDKKNLLSLDFTNWSNKGKAFKQELLRLPDIESATICQWTPAEGGASMSMQFDDPEDKNNKLTVLYIDGDRDLVKTLKLQLRTGRLLNPAFTTDAVNTDSLINIKQFDKLESLQVKQPVLITNYTARIFNVKKLGIQGLFKTGTPVGILNDFNNEDMHTLLKPTVIRAIENPQYGDMLIRINPFSGKKVIASIERLWKSFYPEKIFQYGWVDEKLAQQYKAEQKLQQLFTFFSSLTVLLACLGLYGLSAFTAEQRVREIGIRKVLGASAGRITAMLSSEVLMLIVISLVIASPVALFIMNKWLRDFAYRVYIHWWIFALAGMIVSLIALITVSYQSVKAAIANPVKSLRSE